MADYEQQQDESQYDQPQEQGDQGYAAEEQAPAETENNIDNYNNNNSSNRGNNNRGGDRGGSGRGGNFRGAPRGRGRGDFQQRGRGGFQSRGGGGFAGQKRGFQDQYSGNVSGMEFVKKRKVNDNVHRILVPVKSVKTIIGPKGESIKALKEDAGEGCKISIYTQSTNKVPLPEGTSERVISIEGDMDQLKKCLVDIIPKVQGVPIERVRGKLTLKLMIPEHCCSMVIGPKGANSKAIREETGSTVQVFTDPLPGSGEHVVQLRNQELDQIVAAAVKVFEIIREGKSQNNVLLFEPHIWTPGEFGTTGSYHDDSYGAYGNQGGNQGGYGGNQGGNQGGYGGNQGGNQGGYGGNQGGNQQYYNNQGNNQQSYEDQSYYNEDQSYYNEQGAGYYEEETQGGYDQGYDQGTQGGYQEEAPYVEPAYQAPAPRGRGGRARGPLLGSSPGNRGAARGGSAPPSRGNFAGSRGGRGANGSPRGAPRGGAPRGAPRGRGNGGGDSRGFSRGGRGGPRGAPRGGSRGRGGQY